MKLIIDIPEDVFYREFKDLNDCVITIKALENATPLESQPSDAVSREQALLALTGMDLPTDRDKLIALFTNRIQHLPAVMPQRKRGKWVDKHVIHREEADECIDEWQSAKCDNCGHYHTTPYMYYFTNYKTCPNCGAEMEK